MARDFKIELDNVEMINGSDDLLKDTKVTKVTITGENKLNSLNSTFENCTELTAIEGEINLDGISDMTEMALNTTLDELKIINPTEENIQTDNSLNQVTNVKIGGTKYAKGGVQDVVGSLEWNAENFTYEDVILDNVYTNSSSIEDNKNITVSDTLEQKATSIEITGQTYENLVNGKATENLLDEMSMQQTEGKPTQFTPHMEQPICLEYIEGQTYQNLVDGKGKYKLTDTFSTTWTESNNSIENPPNMIEIPEIFGNTVQGYANLITNQQLADSLNSVTWVNGFGGKNPLVTVNSNGFKFNDYAGSSNENILQDIADNPNAQPIKLKANTTYSLAIKESSFKNFRVYSRTSLLGTQVFTTDSTGEVFITGMGLHNGFSNIVLIEGNDSELILKAGYFDLNYIQSVGDLYVDESGEPILDEEGNEQYKLDMISHGYTTDEVVVNGRAIIQNLLLSTGFLNISVVYGTPTRAYFHCIAKIDTTKARTGTFCTFTQGGGNSIKYNSTDRSLKLFFDGSEYLLGCVNHNDPFSITMKQSDVDKIMHVYFNGIEVTNIASESMAFSHSNFVAFNSQFHTGSSSGCNYINIIYAQCSKDYGVYAGIDEDDWNNINKWNKTTILMPQPLRKVANGSDKLYWDLANRKYYIEKNIFTMILDGTQTYTSAWAKDGYVCTMYNASNPDKVFGKTIICNTLLLGDNPHNSPTECVFTAWNSKIYVVVKGDSYQSVNLWLADNPITVYYYGDSSQTVETKILEKSSLETYLPKTYLTSNSEIQPSQMTVTNKKVDYIPLDLQPNKDYTLQLDSIGKDDKPITVNLGGTEATIQPINDTSKHHKVVVRTPSTLTTDKLELNGEGVVVNDVMLFEGGDNEIRQEVEYVEGIQNIGELTLCKNLFDKFSIELFIGNLNYLTGAELENSEYMRTDYIEILPNKTYTLSGFGDSSMDLGYTLYNDNKSFNKGAVLPSFPITTSFTFTTDSNSKYLKIAYKCSNMDTLQLEEGIVATDYQEYFEGERYKIDVLSNNGNKIFDADTWVNSILDGTALNSGFYKVLGSNMIEIIANDTRTANQVKQIQLKPNTKYSILCNDASLIIYIFFKLQATGQISGRSKIDFTTDETGRIGFKIPNGVGKIVKIDIVDEKGFNYSAWSTQSILLPQPLNKIGDIKDKFYWDDNKGHYCIEQNTSLKIFDKLTFSGGNVSNNVFSGWGGFNIDGGINEKIKPIISHNNRHIKEVFLYYRGSYTEINISIKDCTSIDDANIKLNEDLPLTVLFARATPNIIDLPHLNKKYSVDTYMPNTYIDCPLNPLQPSKLLLKSDTIRYDSIIKPNTLYTIQFNCLKETIAISTLNLGGTIIEVVPTIGLNHFTITTSNTLTSNELSIIDSDSRFIDVIVNEGEMNQYPKYFDGVQSVGELQDDGSYIIGIKTNEGFNIFIQTNNPLTKDDKLYWNPIDRRYEIDRSGSIEIPTVTGDIVDLPRLYQKEDSTINISTDNIEPSKIDISYKDIH